MTQNELTYEDARTKLIEIVAKLEEGTKSLDESLKLWEKGEELAKFCKKFLEDAKTKMNESTK